MTITSTSSEELTVTAPYALDAAEVVAALGTPEGGLTEAQARERLAIVGPNALPEPRRKPAIVRFLSHFNDTLIFILLGAGDRKSVV